MKRQPPPRNPRDDCQFTPFSKNIRKHSYQGGPKYQLFFKAGQADAITAAFKEYTALVMKKERRPSILAQLRKYGEKARQPKRQRQRTREAARNGR